jgi:hypothetical protein
VSKDSQSFSSSQNISQEATQQKKLTKVGDRYIEIEESSKVLTTIKVTSAITVYILLNHIIVQL